jgi:hypothetical protein
LAVLILPAEFVVVDAVRSDGGQAIANRWADSLSSSELSKAGSTLLSYSIPYRKALLARMSPDARAAAWRGVYTTYIAEHPTLTAEQVSLLERVRELTSPKMYGPDPDRELGKTLKPVVDKLVASLGNDVRDPFFLVEGNNNAPQRTPERERGAPVPPLWTRFKYFVAREFVLSAATNCNCYTDTWGNYCAAGMHCSELTGCTWQSWGCGFGQIWPCNGFCVLNS